MGNPTTQEVIQAVEKSKFRSEGLYPLTNNCTGVAVGICRVLDFDKASVVSVYDVDWLVHSLVEYYGVLIDSRGKFGEKGTRKRFVSSFVIAERADCNKALTGLLIALTPDVVSSSSLRKM